MKVLHIPANTAIPITIRDAGGWQDMAKLTGGEYIERVGGGPLQLLDLVIVVDEEGRLRLAPEYNPRADVFYGGGLYGDALIVAEGMTADGPDFVTLPDPEGTLKAINDTLAPLLG